MVFQNGFDESNEYNGKKKQMMPWGNKYLQCINNTGYTE